MNQGNTNRSVWSTNLDDELTASILPSIARSAKKEFFESTTVDQNKLEAMNYELMAVTKKKDEYLELMLKQSDQIKELREQVKARDNQILDLQNKLTEESKI